MNLHHIYFSKYLYNSYTNYVLQFHIFTEHLQKGDKLLKLILYSKIMLIKGFLRFINIHVHFSISCSLIIDIIEVISRYNPLGYITFVLWNVNTSFYLLHYSGKIFSKFQTAINTSLTCYHNLVNRLFCNSIFVIFTFVACNYLSFGKQVN